MNRNQTRGLRGMNKLRRKLRHIHELVENETGEVIEEIAEDVALDMRGLTPVDTGTAVQQIDYKVGRDGLSAKIGIRTKARAKLAFYFRFLDGGTKGNPSRNIPAMPALHIRERAFDANKEAGIRKVKAAIDRTLHKAAQL